MQLVRWREVMSTVAHGFLARWSHVDTQKQKEELMQAILDFGRLRNQVYKTEVVVIDATEIAFRLREARSAIDAAFATLEQQGLAQPTGLPHLWKLDLSDPQKLRRHHDR